MTSPDDAAAEAFTREVAARLHDNSVNNRLKRAASEFMTESIAPKYSYNFSWLGRPIIQYPQDIIAMQEVIWRVKPDLIIETGIARGGSVIFHASMLELNAISGGPPDGRVLAIDIDIRDVNRRAMEEHPMSSRITMISGSSVDPAIVSQVKGVARSKNGVLVVLDSNHTHQHVLAELTSYACLTSVGSYCVVFDTIIDELPRDAFSDRSWGPGNNPRTAVREFLATHPEFEIDERIDDRLLISVAPGGYLKRVR